MDALEKLTLASTEAGLEAAEEAGLGGQSRLRPRTGCGMTPGQLRRRFGGEGIPKEVETRGRSIPIQTAVAPGGRRVLLLKAMQTTACERNCLYCPFRAGRDSRRVTYAAVNDPEVLDAFRFLSKTEGIIPALESAHAVAYVMENAERFEKDDIIVINLSGRGDKDVAEVAALKGRS